MVNYFNAETHQIYEKDVNKCLVMILDLVSSGHQTTGALSANEAPMNYSRHFRGLHHQQWGLRLDLSTQHRGNHLLTSPSLGGVTCPECVPLGSHVSPCLEISPTARGHVEAQIDQDQLKTPLTQTISTSRPGKTLLQILAQDHPDVGRNFESNR